MNSLLNISPCNDEPATEWHYIGPTTMTRTTTGKGLGRIEMIYLMNLILMTKDSKLELKIRDYGLPMMYIHQIPIGIV